MRVSRQIAVNERLRSKPLWKLLAAHNAPLILAMLQTHLMGEERRVPQSILHERINRDLEDLRAEGKEPGQNAQGYVSDWLSAGFVERYFPAGATEEEYEISAAAADAIHFVESMTDQRTTATESRLAMVIQLLVRLVEETDTNSSSRVERLRRERDRIDQELLDAQLGKFKVFDDKQALERVREAISLSDDLISDFRRVREQFDGLNREFRQRLMEETVSRGEILEQLFQGVDLIGESEAGRTFAAFWKLLIDPEQNKTLEDALETICNREFFRLLAPPERTFLRQLTKNLLDQGGTVHDVLQNFARSLKNFVQSREFLEQRRLNQLLTEAQRAALELRDKLPPTEVLDYELPHTSCRIRSLTQFALFDPSMTLDDASVSEAPPADIDIGSIGALVSQSEIDFGVLMDNIRHCLKEEDHISVKQILMRFPASQGLGSVVGYVAIGTRHGIIVNERKETVSWKGNDEQSRSAQLPLIMFTREVFDDQRR